MERVFACDPVKRATLIRERRIDLLDLGEVFADERRIDAVDSRFDYGEQRRVTIGKIHGRLFTVIYTMRGPVTWLITAWLSNRKERSRYG